MKFSASQQKIVNVLLLFLMLILAYAAEQEDDNSHHLDCEMPVISNIAVLKNPETKAIYDPDTTTMIPEGSYVTLICLDNHPLYGSDTSFCDNGEFLPPLGQCGNNDDNEADKHHLILLREASPALALSLATRLASIGHNNDMLQRHLGQAASDGNVNEVEQILTSNALDVNWRDKNEYVYDCHPEFRITIKNATALHRATSVCKGNTTVLEIVRLLADAKADLNAKEGSKYAMTSLHLAANGDHQEVVRFLLDRGAPVDEMDNGYWTALFYAASRGLNDVAKLLIDRGANVNAKAYRNMTVLMVASELGKLETVRLLLDKGAQVGAKSWYGDTAFSRAVEAGQLDVIRLLVQRGA